MKLYSKRKTTLLVAVMAMSLGSSQGQFNMFRDFFQNFQRGVGTVFRPIQHMGHQFMRPFTQPGGRGFLPFFSQPTTSRPEPEEDDDSNLHGGVGGTKEPVSTGNDELYPRDCGRDAKKNTGLLCFPDGKLCEQRVGREGNVEFGGRTYWLSWKSDDFRLKNAKWDWFNARNYCRKRCMDLVSFETEQEYQFIKALMTQDVKYFWTSGRLCNFDGCDRDDFFPKAINGWFWSANQARLNPTNSTTAFHDWSSTGGFQPAKAQPDNREQEQQNGALEACMAVLNNFYGDGIKWHDVACHHEKPIICEDNPGHLNFARQTFPSISIP